MLEFIALLIFWLFVLRLTFSSSLFIQITVVNPAMERSLGFLQKFAVDAHRGKISKDRLRFGAPWRHPPPTDDPTLCTNWARVQLMDFVQSLINTEFGVRILWISILFLFATITSFAIGATECSTKNRIFMAMWWLHYLLPHIFPI